MVLLTPTGPIWQITAFHIFGSPVIIRKPPHTFLQMIWINEKYKLIFLSLHPFAMEGEKSPVVPIQ